VPPEPTWQEFIASTCRVRELAPGDRPREWLESANDSGAGSPAQGRKTTSASTSAPDHGDERATVPAPESPERVDPTTFERLEPERFKVQFTATEEYVHLVEEAKALLSHAVPNVTLEELQLRAMRALVAELKKKKYATVESSTGRAPDPKPADDFAEQPHPRRRVRHIPAATRRTVFERDGNRCSYVDANGAHCAETHRLEFHHLKPFATGGDHRASNLTLRCAAHNALAAEEDFGRELIEDKKNSLLHEPFGPFAG
jgi:hypothetical protein